MADLAELRTVVDKARRARDVMEREVRRHKIEMEAAQRILQDVGIDPEGDLDAQLVTLNQRATEAAEKAAQIIVELDDNLR